MDRFMFFSGDKQFNGEIIRARWFRSAINSILGRLSEDKSTAGRFLNRLLRCCRLGRVSRLDKFSKRISKGVVCFADVICKARNSLLADDALPGADYQR